MRISSRHIKLATFCLSFIALSIRAEISSGEPPAELARAFFDTDALRNNGLDPALAEYFAQAPMFMPGYHNVTLKLNGDRRGIIPARFNDAGQLCVDKTFLQDAGLKKSTRRGDCPTLQHYWRTATVKLVPELEEIELVVPPDAIDEESGRSFADIQGGRAALLNYSAFNSHYNYDGNKSESFQATLEMGFNAGDWIVRSTQILHDSSEESFGSDSLYTYAQRTFADYGVMMQAGEINIANTRFSTPTLYGIQFMPDNMLQADNKSGIDVSGIARTAQARVDIRQSGQLIYSTLVPAGPFTLSDVPVISGTTDLQVTVTETDGSASKFTVAASSFRGNRVMRPVGFSFSAGRAKEMETKFEQPWVFSASNGWSLSRRAGFTAGMVMADNHYYGFSGNLDWIPVQNLSTSLGFLGSVDNMSQTDGTKTTLDLSYALPLNMGLTLGGSYGTPDYREMSELYDDEQDFSATKYDTSVGINWGHETLGFFSVSYYQNKTWNSDYDSRRIITSWTKSFQYGTVTLNWQSDVGNNENSDNDMFYASVNIPLGRGVSTTSWYREREGRSSAGTRASGSLNNDHSYTVGISEDFDNNVTNWDASLSSNLHYTSLALAASGDSDSNSSYSAQISGGMVAHGGGVTFSPYTVNDTFGVVALDKPVAGIEIVTPRGTVWTDKWGQAVVPSLTPYRNSSLNLNTQSLPGNMDVKNGKAVLKASHGAVAKWQFDTLSQRRVLLAITLANGKLLPKGTSIVDKNGEYLTSAPDEGMIFLNDISASQQLYARLEGSRCRLVFTLPEAEPDKFYEEIAGQCIANTGSELQ